MAFIMSAGLKAEALLIINTFSMNTHILAMGLIQGNHFLPFVRHPGL